MTELLVTLGILLSVAGVLYWMLKNRLPAEPVKEIYSHTENGQMSRVFFFPLTGYRSVQVIFKGLEIDQETAAQELSGLEIELTGKAELVAPIQILVHGNLIEVLGTNSNASHFTGRHRTTVRASGIVSNGDIIISQSSGPKSEDQIRVKILLPFDFDFDSEIRGL